MVLVKYPFQNCQVKPHLDLNLQNLKKLVKLPAQYEKILPNISMITFQNKNSFPTVNLKNQEKTTSTLLIPSHLLGHLKQKTKLHKNCLVLYLRTLLKMYRSVTHSGMLPPPRKIKTEYQVEGLDLKRVSFRVSNADWIELGELALAFGKSRCWLFVFLLELDLLGLSKILSKFGLNNSVPTTKKLRLQVSWSLGRISNDFARSYHVRI